MLFLSIISELYHKSKVIFVNFCILFRLVIHLCDKSSSVCVLGFMISDNLTLGKRSLTVCRSAYVEIRHISSIRQYLTVEATQTLICAFVLSWLVYCNSFIWLTTLPSH